MSRHLSIYLLLLLSFPIGAAMADPEYTPSRVVYDISSGDESRLHHLLDRAGLLQKLYGNDPFEASIVLVIHEDAIPKFSSTDAGNRALINRARDFALGEVIEFRLCRASARLQGFDDADFADFIRIVPMADAEIVQMQQQGYAYLR